MDPEIIDLLDSDEETHDVEKATPNIHATCYYCGSIFTVEAAFVNHMEYFHRLGPVAKCPFCYDVCPKKVLENHIKYAHPSQPSSLTSTSTRSSGTITKTPPSHQPACSYSTPTQQFSCVTCGVKFPFQQNLDDHMSVHVYEKKFSIAADAVENESTDKKYKCDICLKSFYVKVALDIHKKKKHIIRRSVKGTLTKNAHKFKCDNSHCDQSFSKPRGLQMHKFHKHKKQEADHAKQETRNSTVKNIFESSSQEYQVIPPSSEDEMTKRRGTKCPLCSKLCKNVRGVKAHMVWQHKQQPLNKSVISIRKKTPGIKRVKKSKKGRFYHAKKKIIPPTCSSNTSAECPVGQNTVQNPPKSFKPASCSFCKETFTFCYNYRQHMETHPIKKNLMCTICSERFAFKVSLESHELLEHNSYAEQLEHCSLCARPFGSQQLRDIHFRTCHKTYLLACQTVHGRQGKFSPSINSNCKSTTTNTSQPTPARQFLVETLNSPHVRQEPDKESPERNIDLFCDVRIPRCEATPLRQDKDPIVISRNEANKSSSLSVDEIRKISEFRVENIKPVPNLPSIFTDLKDGKVSNQLSMKLQLPSRHSFWCNICGKAYLKEKSLIDHLSLSHPFEDFPQTWEQLTPPFRWRTLSVAGARTLMQGRSSSNSPSVSPSPNQQALYEEDDTTESINSLDLS